MDELKQQEAEFYRELVNRFFNENSYFFHCINHELDGVLKETKDGDNQIYLMLGNFFDKLVSAEDVVTELEQLKQVNEFFEFVDKLEQSVSFLHNNELDTERMKIEIEGLAHSMFNSALLAFQTPGIIAYLRNYLNQSDFELEPIVERETGELSSTEPVDVDSGIPDETESLKDSQGNADEKDFRPEAEFGKDVRLMGGLDNSKSNEGSSPVSRDANITSQPDSFVSVFTVEINQKLDSLKEIASAKNLGNKRWKKSTEIIDSIMMTSVIYGFEAYEQIAGKSRKQLRKLLSASEFESAGALLDTTIDHLSTLMAKDDPESVNSSFVKSATNSLKQPQKKASAQPQEEKIVHKKEAREEKKSPSDPIIENRDELIPLLPQDVMKIKIPGEDDEEIHGLIAEISREAAAKKSQPQPENASTVKSRFEEEVVHVKKIEDKMFSIYQQQAELYFNVIDEALVTLEKQRRNKTALEDLELASNALYGLSLKLNLDSIGEFPDLILTLIKNILATNYTITEKDHALIKKGFDYFKNLGNVKEFDGTRFEEITQAITALNRRVKDQASQEVDFISYPSNRRMGFA